MRKFAMFTMLLGVMGLGIGCEKSVQQERQDVVEAQRKANDKVADKQRDVEKAREKGQENVDEAKRELNETARDQQKNVNEEAREAQEAARKQNNESARREPVVPPAIP